MKALCVVLALASVGCADNWMGPTVSPDPSSNARKLPLPEPAPAVEAAPLPATGAPPPSGAGVTSAQTLCFNIKAGVSCEVKAFTEDFATVRFTNTGTLNSESVTLSSYELGADVDSFAAQQVFQHAPTTLLGPGEWADLLVWFPRCNFQVDTYTGPKVNHPPHSDATLLGYEKRTNRGLCAPPPVEPPSDPPPPKSPPRPPLTDCRDGVEIISFVWSAGTATATWKVRPGYAVTLWAAGYDRLQGGWDSQRFLGGVPPKTYTAGTHSVTVPSVLTLSQHDVWCGGEDLYGQDVTPANFAKFNALHDYFSFYLLYPALTFTQFLEGR